MLNRFAVMKVFGALLGLAVAAGTVATASASVRSNRIEYLTFSRAVALPGVTLVGGTYIFEVANPETSADVIRVINRATNKVIYLGFTHRAERPKGMDANRSIVLSEVARGDAPPILGWYPAGDLIGHAFVYSKAR